jgi:hypothetical protein
LYDKHAPVITKRVTRPPAPWLTVEIKKLRKQRNKNRRDVKKMKRNNVLIPEIVNKYKASRNIVNFKTKEAIKNHSKQLLSEKSPKLLWQNVNYFGMGKCPGEQICFSYNELNTLNEFFLNSHTKLNCNQIESCKTTYINSMPILDGEKFHFKHVYPHDIKHSVNCVKSNAKGNDGITIKMLRQLNDAILPSLLTIINFSLQHSIVPDSWKESLVIPLKKNSNPNFPSDYRPISKINVLCKITEKLVLDQVTDYCNNTNIIDQFQSGFRKGHGTGTALLHIIEKIRTNIDDKKVTVLVLLDNTKAFDSLNHDIFYLILNKLNFAKPVINWFKSYFTKRKQCVVSPDKIRSDWGDVTSGCGQGTILGPWCYSVYTHDIGRYIKNCFYHVYADDTQIYYHTPPETINSAVRLINQDLLSLKSYFEFRGLKLNPLKCKAIIIGHPNALKKINIETCDKITIGDVYISYEKKVKDLGLYIDNILSWNGHVTQIYQSVMSSLKKMYKFRKFTPEKTRILFVKTLLCPIIDYCDFIQSNMSYGIKKKLDVLMNGLIRYVYDLDTFEHTTSFYTKMELLKLNERKELHILVIIYKIFYNITPSYLSEFVVKASDVQTRAVRNTNELIKVPKSKLNIYSNSFSVTGGKLWNQLPKNIKTAKTLSSFKANLKQILLKRYN